MLIYSKNETLFNAGGVNSAVVIPNATKNILVLQKDFYKTALNRMATVLTATTVDNLFCCLFRYMGSFDDKFLRVCQAILRLAMNNKSISIMTLDSSLSNLWQTIQKVLLSSMIAILSNLFEEINRQVKGQLNIALSTKSSCASWDSVGNLLLKYIRDIENSILDLAIDLNNSLTLQDKYQEQQALVLTENKTAKKLLKIIEIVLAAKQRGELCKNTTVPTDAELSLLYNTIKDDYTEDTTDTTDTTGTETEDTTNSSVTITAHANFNECLKKVPAEDVEKVMAWIKNLKEQS
jgi:hypothetical protein